MDPPPAFEMTKKAKKRGSTFSILPHRNSRFEETNFLVQKSLINYFVQKVLSYYSEYVLRNRSRLSGCVPQFKFLSEKAFFRQLYIAIFPPSVRGLLLIDKYCSIIIYLHKFCVGVSVNTRKLKIK